jgi:hypothetical protein
MRGLPCTVLGKVEVGLISTSIQIATSTLKLLRTALPLLLIDPTHFRPIAQKALASLYSIGVAIHVKEGIQPM